MDDLNEQTLEMPQIAVEDPNKETFFLTPAEAVRYNMGVKAVNMVIDALEAIEAAGKGVIHAPEVIAKKTKEKVGLMGRLVENAVAGASGGVLAEAAAKEVGGGE